MPKLPPDNFFKGSSPVALVSGGAGFIGSAVCVALLDKNIKVICLDNLQTGLLQNIQDFATNRNFFLLEQDLVKGIPKEIERLDYVLQLAGVEAYLNGEDVSIDTLEANSIGTKNLLEVALSHNARFLLASTIYVYNGPISSTSTSQSFGATRYEEGKFSHNEAKRFAEALSSEYGQKKNLDTRIVRVGDVYGPKMTLATNSLLAHIFKQIANKQSLVLPGRGDSKLYPVYIDDVVSGIIKVLFSSGLKNSIISLVGQKRNLLEIARIVRDVGGIPTDISTDLGIGVDTLDESVENNIEKEKEDQQQNFNWQEKTELIKGLLNTLSWLAENVKPDTKPLKVEKVLSQQNFWEEPKKPDILPVQTLENSRLSFDKNKPRPNFNKLFNLVKIKKLKGNKFTTFTSSILIGVVFWLFILPFFQLVIGLVELSLAKKALIKADSDNARIWSKGSVGWFSASQESFYRWRNIPGIKNEGQKLADKSQLFKEIAKISVSSVGILENSQKLYKGITGGESYDPTADVQELSLQLKALESQVGFLQTEVGDQEISITLPFLKKITAVQEGDLSVIRRASSGLASFIGSIPDLLGNKERKTYLVLFQDSSELRPVGGVVSSYGLMTFEKGHLVNFEIQDVSVADSQLSGYVEPPAPLKQYLGVNTWKLRDVNWNPDFPTTAARAAWFIDKELGLKVNGVVAVDTTFIKKIVKRLGTLKIVETNERVGADVLDGLILQAKSKNSNYILVLAKSLATLLEDKSSNQVTAIGRGLVDSLAQKHIVLWTDNNNANSALARSGWDGSVRKVLCPQVSLGEKSLNCLPDYVQLVEANLGNNSANLFIDREYSLDVTVDKSKITHRLTISYKNMPRQGIGEDYKTYIRLYGSDTSVLTLAASVNGVLQERLSIDETIEKDKKVFGTFITIPRETSRDIVFIWETINSKKVEDGGSLVLFWQKQTGIVSDPVNLRIVLPNDQAYKNSTYPKATLTGDGVISYNTTLSSDLLINTTWQPK